MEDYEEIGNQSKSSKINSAMIVNLTLNELFKDFYKHFRAGYYLSGNNDLDCVWIILGGEPHIEKSQTEKEYIKLNNELTNCGCLTNSIEPHGFGKVPIEVVKRFNRQKVLLLNKAIFLRRLQNSQGKGTAYSDEDDDLM